MRCFISVLVLSVLMGCSKKKPSDLKNGLWITVRPIPLGTHDKDLSRKFEYLQVETQVSNETRVHRIYEKNWESLEIMGTDCGSERSLLITVTIKGYSDLKRTVTDLLKGGRKIPARTCGSMSKPIPVSVYPAGDD